ncbi:MAG: PEP/pyruvate-binding domain-containing protein, partial [Dermatophilaceae bacterium]
MTNYTWASTGVGGLDQVIDGLRLGDNVVWQVDSVAAYRRMVEPFVGQARRAGRRLVYIRFGAHEELISDLTGVSVHRLDASQGFEVCARAVHEILTAEGAWAFYVFDCLTELLSEWHSDLMVMNFFKVICPSLYELDTVAYFALLRGGHTFDTIAGIRETTQVLLDLTQIGDETYVHPLKVWSRHSPTMFFPHRIAGDEARSITSSADAALLFASIDRALQPPDPWLSLVQQGRDALRGDKATQVNARELLLSVLIGRDGRMLDLARRHLGLADLVAIASRVIGSGYIGGKSVGMLLARAILSGERFAERMEPHDSYFVGSDLFYTYIVANGWWKLWASQRTEQGYETAGVELHACLAQGRFPRAVREQFLQMLEYFGQSPIIVRSSSLLEDNFGNAFAGKYDSVFCANQGSPDVRFQALEDAVRTVYASAMSPEALSYRRERGLADLDEQMAVLIQRVSGDHHGRYFFPHAAGVGNSANLYVWEPDLDSSAGMIRLVVGLGTRAVDRTTQDYARIVALDAPTRPVRIDEADAARYSQHGVDLLDLDANELVTVPVAQIAELDIACDWGLFLSTDVATLRRLRELGRWPDKPPVVVDFRRMLGETEVPALLREALRTVAAAYDHPVDVEFTVNFNASGQPRISLVQCRPLQTRGLGEAVAMPDAQAAAGALISTVGNFMGGNVRLPIEYVVMVRPDRYLELGQQERYAVARRIGRLNRSLKGRSFLLIGPGRWGTTTPSLGVPVHFTEIAGAAALCEVTYPAGDFRPELSYGSHFFQDLVESGIFYVAVFDEREDVVFAPQRILERDNVIAEVDPDGGPDGGPDDVIHVARFDSLVLSSD